MKKYILFVFTSMVLGSAYAEGFKETPISWILESYNVNGVVFSRTPATCANGQVVLPGTSSTSERDRLFGVVMSAKMSGKKVFINYSNIGGTCTITTFGVE